MKRLLSTIVAAAGFLAMAALASATPATGNMNKALSEVTNQEQNSSAKKPVKKHSKGQKQQKTHHRSGSATTPPTPYQPGQ